MSLSTNQGTLSHETEKTLVLTAYVAVVPAKSLTPRPTHTALLQPLLFSECPGKPTLSAMQRTRKEMVLFSEAGTGVCWEDLTAFRKQKRFPRVGVSL